MVIVPFCFTELLSYTTETDRLQWSLYEADTIRSKKSVRLIIFKNIRITRILKLLNDTRASTGR